MHLQSAKPNAEYNRQFYNKIVSERCDGYQLTKNTIYIPFETLYSNTSHFDKISMKFLKLGGGCLLAIASTLIFQIILPKLGIIIELIEINRKPLKLSNMSNSIYFVNELKDTKISGCLFLIHLTNFNLYLLKKMYAYKIFINKRK